MATDEIVCVPIAAPKVRIRVIALLKASHAGAFSYLQGMRSGALKVIKANPEETQAATAYHQRKQQFFSMLTNAVPGPIDALLSPASVHPEAIDLTLALIRTGEARDREAILGCPLWLVGHGPVNTSLVAIDEPTKL